MVDADVEDDECQEGDDAEQKCLRQVHVELDVHRVVSVEEGERGER